ncbi:MAG: WxcM-like domain-containing protein [Magnetococcales bacterium]|nr:WxcM-like domain-containing protein [Magnetococcales bacterium]
MKQIQIHAVSDVQSKFIGEGTKIWQYCVVLPNARIGSGCNICAHVLIENDVIIGNNVTIKSGVQLWDGVRIGDGVFVGPNATFTNDPFPRSKEYPEHFHETRIGSGASIGANATILPGISVGAGAMIGAGAVVTKNVPSNAIVVGNPGVITGYVGIAPQDDYKLGSTLKSDPIDVVDMGVGGCFVYTLPLVPDMRGSLSVAEYEKHILPFVPKRCFIVFDVPSREIRGEHAHKELHQYLICVKGSVNVVLDDARMRKEIVLDRPYVGLHIPPLVWGIQYKYSQDAVLLVLASEVYDANDYIRNYDDFLSCLGERDPKR